ncbi:hypothetical protein K2Y11_07105 [bacterium]|nr:hypothetical protein [bacterium]
MTNVHIVVTPSVKARYSIPDPRKDTLCGAPARFGFSNNLDSGRRIPNPNRKLVSNYLFLLAWLLLLFTVIGEMAIGKLLPEGSMVLDGGRELRCLLTAP